MNKFKTIKNNIETEIIVKKSKFIANFYYVESVEEAEEIIKSTKKKYYDSKHNCIAYRIVKENGIIEKSSDDGEPSGTAGAPMLNILQKNDLANIVIIVTRYFGGVLLGTGGLVRAYSDALQEAIKKSEIIEKVLGYEMEVYLEYSNIDKFEYYCKNKKIDIIKIDYLEEVICKIEVEEEKKANFMEDIKNKKIEINKIEELYKKIINKCK